MTAGSASSMSSAAPASSSPVLPSALASVLPSAASASLVASRGTGSGSGGGEPSEGTASATASLPSPTPRFPITVHQQAPGAAGTGVSPASYATAAATGVGTGVSMKPPVAVKARSQPPKDCDLEDFSNYNMDAVNLRRLTYNSLRKFCAQYREDGSTEHGINLNDNRSRTSMLTWAEEEQVRRTGHAPGQLDPFRDALPPPIDPSIPLPNPATSSSSSSSGALRHMPLGPDSPHSSPIPGHASMHDIIQQLSSGSYPHPCAPASRVGEPSRHASRSRHNSVSSTIAASMGFPRGRSPSRPSSSLSVAARLGLQSPTADQANAAAAAAAAVALQHQISAAHASAVMAQRSQSPSMGPQHPAHFMHLHNFPGRAANLGHHAAGLGTLASAARDVPRQESAPGTTPMDMTPAAQSRSPRMRPLPEPRPRSPPPGAAHDFAAPPQMFRGASIASSAPRGGPGGGGLMSTDSLRGESTSRDRQMKPPVASSSSSSVATSDAHRSQSSSSSSSKPKTSSHRPPPLEGGGDKDTSSAARGGVRDTRRHAEFAGVHSRQRQDDADALSAAAGGDAGVGVDAGAPFQRRRLPASDRSCHVDKLTSIGSVTIVGNVEDGRNINNNAQFTDCWSNTAAKANADADAIGGGGDGERGRVIPSAVGGEQGGGGGGGDGIVDASEPSASAFSSSSSSSRHHRQAPPPSSSSSSHHRYDGGGSQRRHYNDHADSTRRDRRFVTNSRSRSPAAARAKPPSPSPSLPPPNSAAAILTDSDSDAESSSYQQRPPKRGRTRKRRQDTQSDNGNRLTNNSRISANFGVDTESPSSSSHHGMHMQSPYAPHAHTSAPTPTSSSGMRRAAAAHSPPRRPTSTSLPPAKKRMRSHTEQNSRFSRAVDTSTNTHTQTASAPSADFNDSTSPPKPHDAALKRVASAFSSRAPSSYQQQMRGHQNLPPQSSSAPATLNTKRSRRDATESPAIVARKRAKTYTTDSPSSPRGAGGGGAGGGEGDTAAAALRDNAMSMDAPDLLVALKASGARASRGSGGGGSGLPRSQAAAFQAPQRITTPTELSAAPTSRSGTVGVLYSASVTGKGGGSSLKIHLHRTPAAQAAAGTSPTSTSAASSNAAELLAR